jgi:pimeloyl-ACP methyl ester carboxylesterase
MHPERVSTLILLNTSARNCVADDYPMGLTSEHADAMISVLRDTWGSPDMARMTNPSLLADSDLVRHLAAVTRCSATPRSAAAQLDVTLRSDARQALTLIQSPTLVLHARDNPLIPVEHGRFLADNIDGARYIELPGGDTASLRRCTRSSTRLPSSSLVSVH